MDKEAVVYIHNGTFLSHKKECIWVSSDEVDEPKVCNIQSEVSQKEKDKHRILRHIWNLEKWYWRIYLQGSSRETDIENRFMDTRGRGRGEGEMYGESNMETYITVCKIDSQQEFAVWIRKLRQGLCFNLEGWDGEEDGKEVQKGGDICILKADSCWGLTENNKILLSNYPPIKIIN